MTAFAQVFKEVRNRTMAPEAMQEPSEGKRNDYLPPKSIPARHAREKHAEAGKSMEESASATKPVFSIADEGRALRNLMWMWWITAVTYNAVAIPVIWDPAQHSFLVRDSTWTPPHLMIFGPFFALMMFEAIVFQFYALKKAQPYIRGDIPITLWVFPITVFGFTLGSMLTNEIGHIFLFREEFFSMPTHWNFVLTFMFIYAVGVPEVVRVLLRLGQLEARAKELVAAEVPAPMPVGAPTRVGRPVARK